MYIVHKGTEQKFPVLMNDILIQGSDRKVIGEIYLLGIIGEPDQEIVSDSVYELVRLRDFRLYQEPKYIHPMLKQVGTRMVPHDFDAVTKYSHFLAIGFPMDSDHFYFEEADNNEEALFFLQEML